MLLKNKIRFEYDTNNLRNLLQQFQKMDFEPFQSILDIDFNVSYYLKLFVSLTNYSLMYY